MNIAIHDNLHNLLTAEGNECGRQDTNQCRSSSTESIKEGNGLWHLNHLHLARDKATNQRTDNQSRIDGPRINYT